MDDKIMNPYSKDVQGTQGAKGIQGTQGIMGPRGVKGLSGSQGLLGLRGPIGIRGSEGVQGPRGLTGHQGIQGVQGLLGIRGSQGVQGFKGELGLRGLQGTYGKKGNEGAQGVQGFKGTIGDPFKIKGIFLTHEKMLEAITNFKYRVGDMVMISTSDPKDPTNGSIYVRGDLHWEYILTITESPMLGPKGDQGEPGSKGATGAKGADGFNPYWKTTGSTILVANNGERDLKGPKGTTGAKRDTGPAGRGVKWTSMFGVPVTADSTEINGTIKPDGIDTDEIKALGIYTYGLSSRFHIVEELSASSYASDGGTILLNAHLDGTGSHNDHVGDVTITAAAFYESSDKRLKENIKILSKGDVNLYEFNFKSDKDKKKHYGVIAQELEEIYPDLVKEDDDGIKSVNYIELLIMEIVKLRKRVKELERRKN